MNLKKTVMMTIAAGMTAFSLAAPMAAFAAEAPAAETASASEEPRELSAEEALELYKQSGYLYTSQRYGFSIVCPTKPVAVVPASMFDGQDYGEVLIFDGEGYDINDYKHAWRIRCKAFEDAAIPDNLAQKSEKEQQAYLDNLMKTMPYEFARFADVLGDGKFGLYAVTAKIWDVDENGDGNVDATYSFDSQRVLTFFRGQLGGHFAVELLENPDITAAHTATYRLGLMTFQEIPVVNNDAVIEKKSEKK